jgi:hypothetical protein
MKPLIFIKNIFQLNIKIRYFHFKIILLSLLSFYNCALQDLVDRAEAYNEIYFALKYKASECKVEIPRLPLILDEQVSRRNLDLCTIAITGSSCTSIDYPLPCLLLYFKEDTGEIPWFLNFKDLSKTKVSL